MFKRLILFIRNFYKLKTIRKNAKKKDGFIYK